MWSTIALAIPILVPSWRFFKTIEPSPRVEWTCVGTDHPPVWQELFPRPEHVSLPQMLLRLFWNPTVNERLYMVSCAERLMETESLHSLRALQARVRAAVGDIPAQEAQVRIVFVSRVGGTIHRETLYQSAPFPVGNRAS